MKLFGVMGDERVAKSLSPAMHNPVLAGTVGGVYVSFAVAPQDVADAVLGFRALGVAGVNVTVPHKQAVARLMDRLSPEAAALGAVNTIQPFDGGLMGHNTDVGGFRAALEHAGFDAAEQTALVMGAGGAARAVVRALVDSGASRVLVAARRVEQAARLTSDLGGEPLGMEQAMEAAGDAALLVNATSASSPDESPELAAWAGELAGKCRPALVMDLNYGREDNFWQALADSRGAGFCDGLEMLAQQARLSFQIWTGLDIPVEEFSRSLKGKS